MPELALIITYSILLIILIFCSIFFSSADMAYGSIATYKLENEYNRIPSKQNKYAFKLSKNYDRTISTILFLNDSVNAGLDTISTLLGISIAGYFFGLKGGEAENIGLIASLICLVIKILFGEIIAKSIGKIFNFKLSKLYSYPLIFFDYLLFPVTYLVSGFGKLISLPITKNIKDNQVSEDELHEMVDEIATSGAMDEENADILRGAIDYASTEAYEIMTPRVDVFAINIEDSLDDILKESELYLYSRIPVYEEDIDNIIGYVLTKTLVRLKLNNINNIPKDILIKPVYLPRSMEINDILREFKKSKNHFAVILDEYGGVEGILTMEDILEEIVGEIYDESDHENEPYKENEDGSYFVDGDMNLEDFCDLFDIDFESIETDYVTIGGYCIELLDDRFAKVNDEIKLDNLNIKIIKVDEKSTVERILVNKIKENED